jgi:acyl-CoA dehydrogenase
MMSSPSPPRLRHGEIRDAVRELCRQFPDSYFRQIDAERGYPEAFARR